MKTEEDILLAKYLGGIATPEEMQELDAWIAQSDENQRFFDEMTALYEKTSQPSYAGAEPDLAKARLAFLAYIQQNKPLQAAPTAKRHHRLTGLGWMYRIAGIFIIGLFGAFIWQLVSEKEMVLATASVHKSGILSDDTKIHLAPNSKIVYSSRYGRKNKNIRLTGKADFAVGHKGNGTLHIDADETIIEDIGTQFEVTAYPDSNFVSVKVANGQVHFYTKSNKGIVLMANETGIYDKKNKKFSIVAQHLDTQKTGAMHVEFKAMVLRDAIDIISNAYRIPIRLKEASIGDRKITVNFDGEDVELVLQVIAETLDLELTKEGKGYLLSKK